MVLAEGKLKNFYEITELDIDYMVKRRLQDMGLTLGTSVKVMSFYSNNAMILNVRGSRVVIGNDVAERIAVEPTVCPYKKHHHHHGRGHCGKKGRMLKGGGVCR